MLSDREQFRLGFLLACANNGLTPDEVRSITKQATALLEKRAVSDRGLGIGKGLQHGLNWWFKTPLSVGMWGLAGSAGLGALGGHLAAKMTEQEIDPDDVKTKELIELYRQHAERARRNAQRLRYRQPRRAPQEMSL